MFRNQIADTERKRKKEKKKAPWAEMFICFNMDIIQKPRRE